MDFTYTAEQKALRDAVRDLLGRREPSHAVGRPHLDTDLWGALSEMGVLSLAWEVADDDTPGAGPVEVMIAAQELGRANAVTPYAEVVTAAHVLSATEEGRALREDLGTGEAVVVPVLSEPNRAWGAPPTVQAKEAGDGWELTGVKGPVPYPESVTHVVVTADTGVFLVASPTIEGSVLVLDGTPATLLTDDPALLVTAVAQGTLAACAEQLGALEQALSMTVDYLKSRKQFGVPLMTFQTLTQRAAVMYTHQELARSAVQYAALVLSDPTAPEDGVDVNATVARAKAVVGKAATLVGEEAVQLHGGIAVTQEYAVGHLLSRLVTLEHLYGDTRSQLARLGRALSSYEVVRVL
jgi:alkylation response protein AidB-like acyl-CoA dehydrogenase